MQLAARQQLRLVTYTIAAASAIALSGCAATQVALEHKDLSVQTKMSNTIFLNPVPPSEQTVYVQFKNTSDKTLNVAALEQEIDANLTNQGYRIVPYNQAHYMLQINVLSVGKMSEAAAQKSLTNGFGGAAFGAAAGAVIGQSWTGAGAGALVGEGIGLIANSLVKDVTYAMITDVQVAERSKQAVNQQTNSSLQQGTSSTTTQQISGTNHWMYYRTRVVSTANKVNLDFKDAVPALQGQLVHSLSGIL
ncbi:complement resistance protein TraT [Acidithiobacillus concretivorus]|uniref:Conjugal transfer protein TraT n=1 Tax=Acidithiobacillus concretivorus TaxID=3063952 RepID=A0ABS5ZRC8_9PROT|nr:complement resistance protein TraT [Acidithiobacillus concretivorus]MBU2739201.1 conjugal transfer protein TraT [Acidithiobacillus concretivorus]